MKKAEPSIMIQGIPYKIIVHKDIKEINDVSRKLDSYYKLDETMNEKKTVVDGFTDYNTKEIHVNIDPNYSFAQISHIFRHEITHAFLYEIGNSNFEDEDYVDKISLWTPQLERLYKESMKSLNKE